MLNDNAYYGHAAVLAEHCGISGPTPPIWGYLQHGVDADVPFTGYQLKASMPTLVWGEPSGRLCTAEGRENVVVVGAPMAYLWAAARDAPESREPLPGKDRTIVYPFHSWERNELDAPHAAFADEIAEREPGDVTVCLYWREAEDPGIVDAYGSRGFRVICHGDRYNRRFLHDQRRELLLHDRFVTNQISTATFYAGLHGLDVDLYGPQFADRVPGPDGQTAPSWDERWPGVFEGPIDQEEVRSLAFDELGAGGLRSPEELIDILGWGRFRRAIAPAVRWSVAARRKAKGLVPLPRADIAARELVAGWATSTPGHRGGGPGGPSTS